MWWYHRSNKRINHKDARQNLSYLPTCIRADGLLPLLLRLMFLSLEESGCDSSFAVYMCYVCTGTKQEQGTWNNWPFYLCVTGRRKTRLFIGELMSESSTAERWLVADTGDDGDPGFLEGHCFEVSTPCLTAAPASIGDSCSVAVQDNCAMRWARGDKTTASHSRVGDVVHYHVHHEEGFCLSLEVRDV